METAFPGNRFPKGANLRSRSRTGSLSFSRPNGMGGADPETGLHLGEDQSPEGPKLRSVAGVKETQQGRPDDPEQGLARRKHSNARGGLGRELAAPPHTVWSSIRWRAQKPREVGLSPACAQVDHAGAEAEQPRMNALKGRASPREELQNRSRNCGAELVQYREIAKRYAGRT